MYVPVDSPLRPRRLSLHYHHLDRLLELLLQDLQEVQAAAIGPVQGQELGTHAEHDLGLPHDGLHN